MVKILDLDFNASSIQYCYYITIYLLLEIVETFYLYTKVLDYLLTFKIHSASLIFSLFAEEQSSSINLR